MNHAEQAALIARTEDSIRSAAAAFLGSGHIEQGRHAEQAEKLLARYKDGQGSDQAAIAHALLAINDTLRDCFGERAQGIPDSRDDVVLILTLQTELAAVNQRIAAALKLADEWSNAGTGTVWFKAADELREVLR